MTTGPTEKLSAGDAAAGDAAPGDAAPGDAAAEERARQEGRAAAAADPFAPNPYRGRRVLSRAWMQGFFEAGGGSSAAALPPPRALPAAPPPVALVLPPLPRVHVQPFATLDSAGYTVRYPVLINDSLVPPATLAALESAWNRLIAAPRRVTFAAVPNAFVVDEGLAFDAELRPIEQTADAYADAEIQAARGRVEAALAAGRVNFHPGVNVLCKRRAAPEYGHYLLEMFPRAYLAKQFLPDQRLHYVLAAAAPALLDTAYRSLFQFGIGLDQLVVTGPEPHRCEHLVVVDGLKDGASYLSPLAVGAVESLGLTVASGPARRLFVLGNEQPLRRLVNQSEIAARFASIGYTVIDPARMTLIEQIASFRAAERVVGVMGPGMANVAFCEPATPVTLLTHAHAPDQLCWLIATVKRLPYTEIRLPPASAEAPDSWSGDYLARPEDVGAALAA